MDAQTKIMMDLLNNPLFKQGATEYFKLAQQQGLDVAKKFWGNYPAASQFPDAQQMFERMADFSSAMGFVPIGKYDELKKENEKLSAENKLLRETLRQLQETFTSENGAKAQEAWQSIVDKQLEMSREVTKSFFEALKQPPK
jgi:regulator of replication initiation timing